VSLCANVPGAVTSLCASAAGAVAITKTVMIQKVDIAVAKCEIALICFIMKIFLVKLLRRSIFIRAANIKNFNFAEKRAT
jgi:hypothetical protein